MGSLISTNFSTSRSRCRKGYSWNSRLQTCVLNSGPPGMPPPNGMPGPGYQQGGTLTKKSRARR